MMSDQSPFPSGQKWDSAAAVTPEFADRRANELAVSSRQPRCRSDHERNPMADLIRFEPSL
jgi:hypothetical protein